MRRGERAELLPLIHSLFNIPSGQTLSLLDTPAPSPLYCISPPCFPPRYLSSRFLSVTISHSPEGTWGTKELAVKCQFFTDAFFRILITGSWSHCLSNVDVSDSKVSLCHTSFSPFMGTHKYRQQQVFHRSTGGNVGVHEIESVSC